MASKTVSTATVPVTLQRDYSLTGSASDSFSSSGSRSGGDSFARASSGGTNSYSNSGQILITGSQASTVGRLTSSFAAARATVGGGQGAAGGTTTGQYTYVASQQGTKRTISTSSYTNTTSTSYNNPVNYTERGTNSASIEQTSRSIKYNLPPAKVTETKSQPITIGTQVGTVPIEHIRGIRICSTGSVTTTQTQTGATTSRTTTTSKFSDSFTTPTEQDFPVRGSAVGNLTYTAASQPTWDAGDGTRETVTPFRIQSTIQINCDASEYVVFSKLDPPSGWNPMSVGFLTGQVATLSPRRTSGETMVALPCQPTFTGTNAPAQPTAKGTYRYGPSSFQYTRYWNGSLNSSVYSDTKDYTAEYTYNTPIAYTYNQTVLNPEIITTTVGIPSHVNSKNVGYVSTTSVATFYGGTYAYIVTVGAPPWVVCEASASYSSSSSNDQGRSRSAGANESGGGTTKWFKDFTEDKMGSPFGVRAGITLEEQVYPEGYVGFGYLSDTPTAFYAGFSWSGFEGDLSGNAFISARSRIGKFGYSNNQSSYRFYDILNAQAGGILIVTDTKNSCVWPAPTSVRTAKPVIKSDVIGFTSDGLQTSTEVAFTSATYKTKTELGGGTTTSEKVTWSFNATYEVYDEIQNSANFRSFQTPRIHVSSNTHEDAYEFQAINGFGYVRAVTLGMQNYQDLPEGTVHFRRGEYAVTRYSGSAVIAQGSTFYTKNETRSFPQGERWVVTYRDPMYANDTPYYTVSVKSIDNPIPAITY